MVTLLPLTVIQEGSGSMGIRILLWSSVREVTAHCQVMLSPMKMAGMRKGVSSNLGCEPERSHMEVGQACACAWEETVPSVPA